MPASGLAQASGTEKGLRPLVIGFRQGRYGGACVVNHQIVACPLVQIVEKLIQLQAGFGFAPAQGHRKGRKR